MANSNHGKQKPMKQEESKRNRGENKRNRGEKRRKITKIIPLKKDDLIYKCAVCNNVDGSCLYAVCEGCQYRHMSKKRKKIVSNDECRKSCHHELHNLIPDGNIWWCTKSKINGQEWKMRPQGCALCGGKFCRED